MRSRTVTSLIKASFLSCFLGLNIGVLVIDTINPVLAATKSKKEAPATIPNPLDPTLDEPLLPKPPVARPLSPLERWRLQKATDGFNAQATAELAAGNVDGAFALWYRAYRLQRNLGMTPLAEVQTLGNIGQVAWEKSRKFDIQVITARLQEIQQQAETQPALDIELLAALGQSYQQIRYPQGVLAVYRRILVHTREQGDVAGEMATLEIIGQSYLAWFDYVEAAKTYEELLIIARSQLDAVKEIAYLQQLQYIYDQAKQPENAVKIKQKIADNYIQTQQLDRLPQIKLDIGIDYQTLGQLELASQHYQEAFSLAWGLRQLGVAADALEKLGDLYYQNQYRDFALQIYQELIKVKQQSYDFYGLMTTYDKIGKIYLEQNNYNQALVSFNQGLELAKSLDYKQEYFTDQIQQINQQIK